MESTAIVSSTQSEPRRERRPAARLNAPSAEAAPEFGVAYSTSRGRMYRGYVEQFLAAPVSGRYRGRVQLIFFSPPFPLNRKKKYGNKQGESYVDWLADLAPRLTELLTPDGSIVIELGNGWEPGRPVMSVLTMKALLAFAERGELNLCQQFVCENPARLPGPAPWVTLERMRVKDSFTHVWWMAPSDRPKADNRNVLKPYSGAMAKLLARGKYNAGRRPSQHVINDTSFLADNGGAIPGNHLSFPNTAAEPYLERCKAAGVAPHPARMPSQLAEFFIKFLTDEGDLVLDPFGGSNTTGAAAQALKRRWVAIEPVDSYIESSKYRFARVDAP